MEGAVYGGESQLLPGVSRQPGGEETNKHQPVTSRVHTVFLPSLLLLLLSFIRRFLKEFLHARSCCLQGALFSPQRRSTWSWWTSASPMTPVSKRSHQDLTTGNTTKLIIFTNANMHRVRSQDHLFLFLTDCWLVCSENHSYRVNSASDVCVLKTDVCPPSDPSFLRHAVIWLFAHKHAHKGMLGVCLTLTASHS